jgi:endothelin-converting enzyme/putative endopeptidase
MFPAGFLQSPNFDINFPIALNYGATGVILGHEFTHGFDTRGAKFDSQGRKRNWWTSTSKSRFLERAYCIEKQYHGSELEHGSYVNGTRSLAENIADNAGLQLAFRAFKRATQHTDSVQLRVGSRLYSEDQLFFLSYAQTHCSVISAETERNKVPMMEHAPEAARIRFPLSNFGEFAQAFGCRSGSNMFLPEEQRCRVWSIEE